MPVELLTLIKWHFWNFKHGFAGGVTFFSLAFCLSVAGFHLVGFHILGGFFVRAVVII